MVPIVVVPGIIAALMLVWVGQAQLRYAARIDSDAFLLSRRRVALGIRRLTGVVYALAIAVAGTSVLTYMGAQEAHQRIVTRLTNTIEAQRQQLEEVDRLLVEAKLRLESANRQLSSARQNPVAIAAVSDAGSSVGDPVSAHGALTAYVHLPGAASVYLRDAPAGRIIGSLKNGEAVSMEAGPAEFAGGHFWTRVRTAAGLKGWAIKEAISTESS